MSLINLICPHCGGDFEMDSERPLQSYWVCPYCGNRSLMQKIDETIRLRGIIPGRAQGTTTDESPTEETHPGSSAESAEAETPVEKPANPVTSEPEPEPEPVPELPAADHPRSLADYIAEASDAEPVPAELPEVPQAAPPAANSSPRPATPPAPADETLERLYRLAAEAAANRDYPLFNAYSRQAVDRSPTDPRIYALRAEMTEEADGFARATWSSLGWPFLTPRRKAALIAQHLYQLNTALKYSRPSQATDLIGRIAWQLVRQAIDFFTEQAELRCQKRLFFKTFKGRFAGSDLKTAAYFLDALRRINQQTCPHGHAELIDAVRAEISLAPPRIARRLRRL